MYQSGVFYVNLKNVNGKIIDKGTIFLDLYNEIYQDNASEAIHRFARQLQFT